MYCKRVKASVKIICSFYQVITCIFHFCHTFLHLNKGIVGLTTDKIARYKICYRPINMIRYELYLCQ